MNEDMNEGVDEEMEEETGDNSLPLLGEVLISWESPEFVEHKRSSTWYLIGGLLAMLAILYALFIEKSWTMAIAIALLMGVIYLYSYEKPKDKRVEITTVGIKVGSKFYQYGDLKSFWLILDENYRELVLELAGRFAKRQTIVLPADADVVEIRETLNKQIPEEGGKSENLVDNWARKLKL